MDDIIAANIRQRREQRSWTQEHLAAAASVDVRTVQRAEGGRGMSAETLQAIAGALDVPVDLLRADPLDFLARAFGVKKEELTPELIEQRVKEHEAKYTTVPLTQVKASGDLALIYDTDGAVFDCQTENDGARDGAAELEQWLTDMVDLAHDIDATQRRDYEKQAFGAVERLATLGFAVSVGVRRHGIRAGNGPVMPFRTLYVIVAPKERATTMAVVEKAQRCSIA